MKNSLIILFSCIALNANSQLPEIPVDENVMNKEIEFIDEFDSTLIGLEIRLRDKRVPSGVVENGVYRATGSKKEHTLYFLGTNKAISIHNFLLWEQYMGRYPEAKKAFHQYKSALLASGAGMLVFAVGGLTAIGTYDGNHPNVHKGAIAVTVAGLVSFPVFKIVSQAKLKKSVELYNEGVRKEQPKQSPLKL